MVIPSANQYKEKSIRSQPEPLKSQPSKQPKTREIVSDQAVIGFRFESDWLRRWHDFSGPMRERNHLRKSKEIPGHLTRIAYQKKATPSTS